MSGICEKGNDHQQTEGGSCADSQQGNHEQSDSQGDENLFIQPVTEEAAENNGNQTGDALNTDDGAPFRQLQTIALEELRHQRTDHGVGNSKYENKDVEDKRDWQW